MRQDNDARSASLQRRRFLQLAGTTAVTATAGCVGGSSNNSGDSQTIQMLSGNPGGESITREAISDFESETNYSIKLTYTTQGLSTQAKVERMAASGNPPDVIVHSDGSTFRWQQRGVVEPITDIVKKGNLTDPVSVEGESYLAPLYTYPTATWYRSDLFDEEPTSWEILLSESKRISSENQIDGYGIPSGESTNAESSLQQHLWNAGVELFSGGTANPEVVLDKQQNKKQAIKTFEKLNELSEYSPNASGWGWGDTANALQVGNVAAAPGAGGIFPTVIQSDRPELLEKMSATMFPLSSDSGMDHLFSYTEGLLLRSDGNATEGGREYISYFIENDYLMDYVMSSPLEMLPPKKELLSNEQWRQNGVYQYTPEWVDQVESNWDKITGYHQTGDDTAPQYPYSQGHVNSVIGKAADQMLVGSSSPSEAIDSLIKSLKDLPSSP